MRLGAIACWFAMTVIAARPGVGEAQSKRSKRVAAPVVASWTTNVVAKRGQTGWTGLYSCPAGGTAGSVWGTRVYTDDSSICTAAVHAGVITLAGGGTISVAVGPGEPSYTGTVQNGVSSSKYGKWAGSFVIVGGQAGKVPNKPKVAVVKATWSDNAVALRGKIGTRAVYICPPKGTIGNVWGTGTYTDDSSICSAGVHAGKITRAAGGRVTIEITPGLGGYLGTGANGVTSHSYGRWSGSYVLR